MTQSPHHLVSPAGENLAYFHSNGKSPGVIFLGGFKADMSGTKATILSKWCFDQGLQFTRFDYSGHGQSQGRFVDGSIGRWLADSLLIVDKITEGPQVIVGSSMGAWLMLLVALRRPERVAALFGIAAAADFTENLIWKNLDDTQRNSLAESGKIDQPSSYQDEPYPVTMHLIEEARSHLLLEDSIPISCPVRLVHGQSDVDVPWQTSIKIGEKLTSDDVQIHLVKDVEHRFSRAQDIQFILDRLTDLLRHIKTS
ncbi:MAG: alpha/beta hydrolase [bacterium]